VRVNLRQMPLQLAVAGKRVAADPAVVRQLVGVSPHVRLERVERAERARAVAAVVRHLAGVRPHVHAQLVREAEHSAADTAAERRRRVAAHVGTERGPVGERPPADRAHDAVAGVGPHVLAQAVCVVERLVAGAAAVRPVARVDAQVRSELERRAEALPARRADVRLHAGVRPLVDGEMARLAERLLADVALERTLAHVTAHVALHHLQQHVLLAAQPADVLARPGLELDHALPAGGPGGFRRQTHSVAGNGWILGVHLHHHHHHQRIPGSRPNRGGSRISQGRVSNPSETGTGGRVPKAPRGVRSGEGSVPLPRKFLYFLY